MLNFEDRRGPDLGTAAPVYPGRQVPAWYRDAKLGFFVHWGLFSVPAWAVVHGDRAVPVEDAYGWHQYAEWYGNTVRIDNSPTRVRHEELYGVGTSYEDFADMWHADDFSASVLIDTLRRAGGQYVVPTTKHHDGFCLWDTGTTAFNAVQRGPRRDLVKELHDATRAAGLRFGVYFSGALDWHVSEFPPIESDTDLFRLRRADERFSRYAAAQLEELVMRFDPDVLWNDIEWPDGGKGPEPYGLAAVLGRYFAAVPDGVVNDRWGIPYHGFLTREYSYVEEVLDTPWESTRGLGLSFGYNQAEDVALTLSGADLIHQLVDVVSKNGNLLINVGPRADGSLPELQLATLNELGSWMDVNSRAIYGTRPWERPGDASRTGGSAVSYTAADNTLYIHVLEPAAGFFTVPDELPLATQVSWLTGTGGTAASAAVGTDRTCVVPHELSKAPVAVAAASLRG